MGLFFKKRNKEEAKTENKEVETEKKMTVLDMQHCPFWSCNFVYLYFATNSQIYSNDVNGYVC